MQPVLYGGGDTGLVRTVERHGRPAVRGRHRVAPRTYRGDRASGRDGAERQPGATPAEQRPTGRGGAAGGRRGFGGVLLLIGHDRSLPARYFVTAAASRDSGSASALTASDSSLRSALPTFSYEVNS